MTPTGKCPGIGCPGWLPTGWPGLATTPDHKNTQPKLCNVSWLPLQLQSPAPGKGARETQSLDPKHHVSGIIGPDQLRMHFQSKIQRSELTPPCNFNCSNSTARRNAIFSNDCSAFWSFTQGMQPTLNWDCLEGQSRGGSCNHHRSGN